MKRILILLGLIGIFGTSPLLAVAADTDSNVVSPQAIELARTLPLVDVHFHFMYNMTPGELKERMDKHNIQWVVGAGAVEGFTGTESFERDLMVKRLLGQRYLPSVGWMSIRRADSDEGNARIYTDPANARRESLLKLLDEQLTAEPQAVFSELHANAESSSTILHLKRRLPTDAPLFVELYKLGVKHQRPLPLHMQWHPDSVERLGKLLASDRKGAVLLSHCGKDTEANQIRAFFQLHPNVYCDLSYRSLPQTLRESQTDPARTIYWGKSMFENAGAKQEWIQLIEDFPDRFMVGVDDVHRWGTYDDVVDSIRTGLLPFLKPETAAKVAYQNAVQLFRLKQ
ncbi:MAG: amidohydrolase [Gammaproteobacteria bacterium]|nr:amidohydrolase [Gammaproteobacteria bacterium]MBU0785866.1 amidohydrolase [Gammaproteobacteria bacterium]MBU0815838.1 amidohydrolase [Gammaproteobacteria bacterium]MBU1787377.1 amidohydrolase [Gammaproteobacteria bacterium]